MHRIKTGNSLRTIEQGHQTSHRDEFDDAKVYLKSIREGQAFPLAPYVTIVGKVNLAVRVLGSEQERSPVPLGDRQTISVKIFANKVQRYI